MLESVSQSVLESGECSSVLNTKGKSREVSPRWRGESSTSMHGAEELPRNNDPPSTPGGARWSVTGLVSRHHKGDRVPAQPFGV